MNKMNREIKFKCVLKHDITGEIVLSKPFTLDDLMNTTLSQRMPEAYLPEIGIKSHFAGFNPVCNIQSTGLADRNGGEIFEGDIIDINQTVNGQSRFYITSIFPPTVKYCFDGRVYEYDVLELLDVKNQEDTEISILGNIHQHPHLLK